MTDTTLAKIQVRRGDLDDLPILAEGELGYALNERRLFVGNTPVTFTADGTTTAFSVNDSTILPGQLMVLVNGSERELNVDYNLNETDIVFATAPAAGSVITVSFNTEVQTQNYVLNYHRVNLTGSVTDQDTGLSFLLSTANTAVIDYSLLNTNNAIAAGVVRVITNGVTAVADTSQSNIGSTGISFGARIESITQGGVEVDKRIHLTYTNTETYNANFYYSIKLWNTI